MQARMERIADQIHPCDDISHKYGTHEEINDKQGINHKPCLICPLDKKAVENAKVTIIFQKSGIQ